jgi:outer membrane protein OmpA-like peptidoglycan-associated protein
MRKVITIAVLMLGTTLVSAQTVENQITDAVTAVNADSILELHERISLLETQIAELIMINEINNINDIEVRFESDSYELSLEEQSKLQPVIDFMRTHPNFGFDLEGYADERGSREYNLALGQRRAHAVRDYLISNGLADYRIRTETYGKDRAICIDSSPECWAQNRRVKIYVITMTN